MSSPPVVDLCASPPPPLPLPSGFGERAPCAHTFLEPVPYLLGYRIQLGLLEVFLRDRDLPPQLLLLEHEPVATLGRTAELPAGVSLPFSLYRTHRGGKITFHGPGQLVGYLLLDLRREGLGVLSFVDRMEQALLRSCLSLGVPAFTLPGTRGIFTPSGKLISLGIAVRRGITWHGFSLNLSDVSTLFLLPPCGLSGMAADHLARYSSLSREKVGEFLTRELFSALGYTRVSLATWSLATFPTPEELDATPCLDPC